jgi:hypothetical protein
MLWKEAVQEWIKANRKHFDIMTNLIDRKTKLIKEQDDYVKKQSMFIIMQLLCLCQDLWTYAFNFCVASAYNTIQKECLFNSAYETTNVRG